MNSIKNSDGKKPVIPVITGPTASGKTSVTVALAEEYPQIEIISADSRQIYKHLSIGTDKPSKELLDKYKFHLVDFVEPGERYTAFDFVDDSNKLIGDILSRGNIPIISGGTGLYIRALVEGIVQIPEDDFSIRSQLEEEVITKGPKYLFERLQEIDPEEAAKVHPHNIKKIIRAIEIYHLTGQTKSDLINRENNINPDFNFEVCCLMPNRELLYERINIRVDEMIKSGLLDEVEKLIKSGREEAVKAVNVIGYNELFRYFNGEIPLETAVNLIKQNSRRFAKRQITWFKGMEDISYFETGETLKNHISEILKN